MRQKHHIVVFGMCFGALMLLVLRQVVFFSVALCPREKDKDVSSSVWKEGETPRVTHVIMPFHESQLSKVKANIELWSALPPCDVSSKTEKRLPTLVLHVSFSRKASNVTSQVEAAVNATYLQSMESTPRRCFHDVRIVSQQLQSSQDSHVNGARLMFEEMLHGRLAEGMEYVLYMEPDVKPVQANWLQQVSMNVASSQEEFWIKGSIYRGAVQNVIRTSYIPNLYHINGNAIYNLKPGAFPKFYFEHVRPFVVKVHKRSANAYDTDIYEFLHDKRNYKIAKDVQHYYQYTDLIQNQWKTRWSAKDIVSTNPKTVLVHGGYQIGQEVFTIKRATKSPIQLRPGRTSKVAAANDKANETSLKS